LLGGAAALVAPEDGHGVITAVRGLARDLVARGRLGRAARIRAATLLDRDAILTRLEASLDETIRGVMPAPDAALERAEAA
jgi:hypothetical protein